MTNLPVSTAVRHRRTVYRFREAPIPDGLLEELLEGATMAPNHRRTQPWRFVVVRGDGKERLADLRLRLAEERSRADGKPLGNRDALRRDLTEPAAIVYVLQTADTDARRRREDYASCAIAAYILQLSSWERGIGARWHTGQLAGDDPRVRSFLAMSDEEEIVCYLALGYPKEVPQAWDRTAAPQLTRYIE